MTESDDLAAGCELDGDHEQMPSELTPELYQELRAAARRQLRRLRPGQTLNTTALVHEAYLKVADRGASEWQDRNHFISAAAVTMRHILVDYARRRMSKKHGGDHVRVTLGNPDIHTDNKTVEVLAVNEALTALSVRSPRLGQMVELRYFGGLSVEETAGVLKTSERTVKRDWRKAKAVLFHMLNGQRPEPMELPVDDGQPPA